MSDATVAIIGAGIGGVYLAAKLGTLSCRLQMTDRDETRLADIRGRGRLDVERVVASPGASVPTLEDWFERTYGVRGALRGPHGSRGDGRDADPAHGRGGVSIAGTQDKCNIPYRSSKLNRGSLA